ncbi:MAG: hypothetical protein KIPDCIKN_04362 [Haliscomenobacter sp.]|nr:hypothetical protein [Haliscomenobacter sp.]
MLNIFNGMRFIDGANQGMDLGFTNSNAARAGTGIDVKQGIDNGDFGEVHAFCVVQARGAAETITVALQESADNSNWSNVAGCTKTLDATNEVAGVGADWNHPDRLRYARVRCTVTGANESTYGAFTLRHRPKLGLKSVDSGFSANT